MRLLSQAYIWFVNLLAYHAIAITFGHVALIVCLVVFSAFYYQDEQLGNSDIIGAISILFLFIACIGGYRLAGLTLLLSATMLTLMTIHYILDLYYPKLLTANVENTMLIITVCCVVALFIKGA